MDNLDTTSGAADFDFIIGSWQVRHRRLTKRMVGCSEWIEFDGTSTTRKILGGCGNVEDNDIALPDGAYRAAAFRSFDRTTGNWSIWWLDGRNPQHLDTPVVGRFEAGTGRFFAKDSIDGTPILVRFLWLPLDSRTARWEQAFSADDGCSWETNWTMDFKRVPEANPA